MEEEAIAAVQKPSLESLEIEIGKLKSRAQEISGFFTRKKEDAKNRIDDEYEDIGEFWEIERQAMEVLTLLTSAAEDASDYGNIREGWFAKMLTDLRLHVGDSKGKVEDCESQTEKMNKKIASTERNLSSASSALNRGTKEHKDEMAEKRKKLYHGSIGISDGDGIEDLQDRVKRNMAQLDGREKEAEQIIKERCQKIATVKAEMETALDEIERAENMIKELDLIRDMFTKVNKISQGIIHEWKSVVTRRVQVMGAKGPFNAPIKFYDLADIMLLNFVCHRCKTVPKFSIRFTPGKMDEDQRIRLAEALALLRGYGATVNENVVFHLNLENGNYSILDDGVHEDDTSEG